MSRIFSSSRWLPLPMIASTLAFLSFVVAGLSQETTQPPRESERLVEPVPPAGNERGVPQGLSAERGVPSGTAEPPIPPEDDGQWRQPVDYQAADSMVYEHPTRKMTLYNQSRIAYQDKQLHAIMPRWRGQRVPCMPTTRRTVLVTCCKNHISWRRAVYMRRPASPTTPKASRWWLRGLLRKRMRLICTAVR